MRDGDVLLEIDGHLLAPSKGRSTLLRASQLLQGPEGSDVSILGRHTSKASKAPPSPYQITLTRCQVPNVKNAVQSPEDSESSPAGSAPGPGLVGHKAKGASCPSSASTTAPKSLQEDSPPSEPHKPCQTCTTSLPKLTPSGAASLAKLTSPGKDCPESPAPERHKGFQNRVGRRRGIGVGEGHAHAGNAGGECCCGQGHLCTCQMHVCVCQQTHSAPYHDDVWLEAVNAGETAGGGGDDGPREDTSGTSQMLVCWGRAHGVSYDLRGIAAPGEWDDHFKVYARGADAQPPDGTTTAPLQTKDQGHSKAPPTTILRPVAVASSVQNFVLGSCSLNC